MKTYIVNTEYVEEIFTAENLEKAREKVLGEIDIQEKDMVETAQEIVDTSEYDKNELNEEKKKVKKYSVNFTPKN